MAHVGVRGPLPAPAAFLLPGQKIEGLQLVGRQRRAKAVDYL